MEKNKASQDSIKILNRRSFIITAIGLILSFIVSIRLFSLQILNFSFYQKKSVENKVSVKATPPLRGDIFDNEKNLVAANAALYEFVIYKNLNKNYLDEINKLNNLINLDLKYLIFQINLNYLILIHHLFYLELIGNKLLNLKKINFFLHQ